MGLIEDLANGAGLRLRHSGGLRLIAASDAHAFLDACRKSGVQVLGAEGFDVLDDSVRPVMEAILDLSEVNDASESVVEAKRFVDAVRRPNLTLEFTLATPGAP